MWNQNRNFGLNPRSDIRIEQFKSLNCFFTLSKGFVSWVAEFVEVRFFASVSYSCGTKIVIWVEFIARTSELSNSKAWIVFLPFLRGSWAEKLNLLKFDFSRLFPTHVEPKSLGQNPSSDIRIEKFKSLNCFFTISKGFVTWEAEFVEVRFFASVSYSCGTKIVIWAKILVRTSELSSSKAWIVFLPFLRGSWAEKLNS